MEVMEIKVNVGEKRSWDRVWEWKKFREKWVQRKRYRLYLIL